ncbi:hypothetical protein QE152_g19140 [Popillia japonica]|uniref:Uncharacterized protein n=1 Tax=Popillia japonica TaxID=7064 RepID=A0AAW1KY58_POPJA
MFYIIIGEIPSTSTTTLTNLSSYTESSELLIQLRILLDVCNHSQFFFRSIDSRNNNTIREIFLHYINTIGGRHSKDSINRILEKYYLLTRCNSKKKYQSKRI